MSRDFSVIVAGGGPAGSAAAIVLAKGGRRVLLVDDAAANVIGLKGARRVPLCAFFTGPGQTVLERGEIVESIDLPLPNAPRGAAFGRLARRQGVDLAR